MAINTRIHEKRFHLLDVDIKSGKVQRLIDSGWTQLQVARKYDVTEGTIKSYCKQGKLDFKARRKGKKADEVAISEAMTPAKRLAMSGAW